MTTTFQKPTNDSPLTLEKLRDMILNLPEPTPGPLNGATVLYVHPSKVGEAKRIVDAYAQIGSVIHIQQSLLASEKVIAGFRGHECVCIINLENSK